MEQQPQNRAVTFGERVVGLVILNLLTVAFSLPIITAGAAFSALYYAIFRLLDGEKHPAQDFMKAFKRDFKQATPVWLLLLAFLAAIFGVWYYLRVTGNTSDWGGAVLVALGFWFLMMFSWLFPLVSRFDNRFILTLRNALMLGVLNLPKTILMILLNAVFPILAIWRWDLTVWLLPLFLVACYSVPAYFCALLAKKPLKKMEPKPVEETEEESKEPDPEEERRNRLYYVAPPEEDDQ